MFVWEGFKSNQMPLLCPFPRRNRPFWQAYKPHYMQRAQSTPSIYLLYIYRLQNVSDSIGACHIARGWILFTHSLFLKINSVPREPGIHIICSQWPQIMYWSLSWVVLICLDLGRIRVIFCPVAHAQHHLVRQIWHNKQVTITAPWYEEIVRVYSLNSIPGWCWLFEGWKVKSLRGLRFTLACCQKQMGYDWWWGRLVRFKVVSA